MSPFYVLASIIVALAAAYLKKNWKRLRYSKDVPFPIPAIKRTDLYFGFYGCQDNQVAETKGSFNLLIEQQADGYAKCVQNILDAGTDVLLYVPSQVFSLNVPGQKHTVMPGVESRLRDLFSDLRRDGALKYVKAICPIDEPNNTVADSTELSNAIQSIKAVAAEFTELTGLKLATFYAADKPFICQNLYDWVGFDDYDMHSSVLVGAQYQALVASLRPGQRTMLIPGAAYMQDPGPFVNYAQAHQEVIAVVSFLWFDARNSDVGAPGARSNGAGAIYLDAGKSVITH